MSTPSSNDLTRFGFPLDEEHIAIHDGMFRFGEEVLAPGATERDRSKNFPRAEIEQLAALGGMGMKVSSEDDGPGADATGYALAVQAIAYWDPSVAVSMVASNLAAGVLAAHANADQKARFLAPVARGERGAAAFALTEPGAGSDAAAIRTRATRAPDGQGWLLNGEKQWITSGSDAEVFVLFAKTALPETGEDGVSCFVLEAGTPGFTVGRIEDKMGLRSSGTAQLFLEDVRLSDDRVVGSVGAGYRVALTALAPSRIAIAAQSIGIAERAFDLGRAYAMERQAFGRPVADFQNSRFTLADCRTELDQAWLLMLRAARLLDQKRPVRTEASMAKVAASEICGRVVDKMLQLHGGNGYSRDYEIERLYRDARVMRIYEGTSEIQRDLIARDILAAD